MSRICELLIFGWKSQPRRYPAVCWLGLAGIAPRSFPSKWQFRLHGYRAHGHFTWMRRFMFDGGTCVACLRDFHDRNRLRQHLVYHDETCFRWLQANMHPMTDEQIKVDDSEELKLPIDFPG